MSGREIFSVKKTSWMMMSNVMWNLHMTSFWSRCSEFLELDLKKEGTLVRQQMTWRLEGERGVFRVETAWGQ